MGRGKSHKPSGIITITTDFGNNDPYISQMKGVILNINLNAKIIDISNDIPAGGIFSASFCLFGAFRYFPSGTVHLAVVDPGVGTGRSGLIIETDEYFFVGPDNGIFTLPLRQEKIKKIVVIDESRFSGASFTFHGRDIFAPVSAELSCGVEPEKFGVCLSEKELTKIKNIDPVFKKNVIMGSIIHIDNFGNLITNIDGRSIQNRIITVEVKGHKISGVVKTYGEKSEGSLLTLINSYGLLEVAVNRGSAQRQLRAKLFDPVRVIISRG